MDAHRIQVLDRAYDDAVVAPVAHDLHLELLPAEHRLLDQHLGGGGCFEPALADLHELLAVVRDAPAGPAQGEGGADDRGEADVRLHGDGLLQIAGRRRARAFEPDAGHRGAEPLAVLGLVDRLAARPDELDAERLQHPLAREVERAVEAGLAAHRGQQGVGTFLLDDPRDDLPVHRLDVGRIGESGVGHDGGRVGVHQHHPETLLCERLARLRAGVVELAGLPDDDWSRPDDQDRFDVATLRHRRLLRPVRRRNDTRVTHVRRSTARGGPEAVSRAGPARCARAIGESVPPPHTGHVSRPGSARRART